MLGKKLILKPYYKYSKYVNEEYSNELSSNLPYSCVKESRMCATPNHQLNINNPRMILMENIRQSCVLKLYGMETYWNYMIIFGELCTDLNKPNFSEECASKVLNISIIDYEAINKLHEKYD